MSSVEIPAVILVQDKCTRRGFGLSSVNIADGAFDLTQAGIDLPLSLSTSD